MDQAQKRDSTLDEARPSKRIRKKRILYKDLEFPSSHKKNNSGTDAIYKKDDYLAIRADNGSFFLCQTLQNIYEHHTTFNARWLELESAEKGMNGRSLYKFVYKERLQFDAIVTQVILVRVNTKVMALAAEECDRIRKLVTAAEKGIASEAIDQDLFEPPETQKKTPKGKPLMASPSTGALKAKRKSGTDDVDGGKVKKPRKESNKEAEKSAKGAILPLSGNKKMASERLSLFESLGSPIPLQEHLASTSKTSPPKKSPPKKSSPKKQPVKSLKKASPKSKSKAATNGKTVSKKKKMTVAHKIPKLKKSSSIQKASSLVKRAKLKKQGSQESIQLKPRKKPKRTGPLDPNRKLCANHNIEVLLKNPLYHSREEVPFVSTEAHNNLVIRAVKLNDLKMLQSLIADSKQISKLNQFQSIHQEHTPLSCAIESGNKAMVDKLIKELHPRGFGKTSRRAKITTSYLSKQETGRYNKVSLGLKFVRKIQVSRGGKEGNNALTKTSFHGQFDLQKYLLTPDANMTTLEYLIKHHVITDEQLPYQIHHVIRSGNRHLACQLIAHGDKYTPVLMGFNGLHTESMSYDNKDFTTPVLMQSVKKMASNNASITPVHCAALNPNIKYLQKLTEVNPNYILTDTDLWQPEHYAAVCEGSGPLKFLAEMSGRYFIDANKDGHTALHLACKAGRVENVEFILKSAKDRLKATEKDGEVKPSKYGIGDVNLAIKTGWCPIHFAAAGEHQDVIEVLLKYGASIDKPMSAAYNRITALIMATQAGNMDLVKYLISRRAKLERPDKRGRTVLIHAVREGHAHLVSLFLHMGCNPNSQDKSSNSALHYAAAYGWYHCVKLLLQAGAKPDPPNDWKLTPMSVSYLKGHEGISNLLLEIEGVNINFQNEQGQTMLMQTIDHTDADFDELHNKLQDLIENKRADCTLIDKQGYSVLHYVLKKAPLQGLFTPVFGDKLNDGQLRAISNHRADMLKLSKLLVKNGCPLKSTNLSKSPLLLQIEMSNGYANLDLMKYLTTEMRSIPEDDPKPTLDAKCRQTVLHTLCALVKWEPQREYLKWLMDVCRQNNDMGDTIKEQLSNLANVRNSAGETPLIIALMKYGDMYKINNNVDPAADAVLEILQFLMDDLKSDLQYEWIEKGHGLIKQVQRVMTAAGVILDYNKWGDHSKKAWDVLIRFKPNVNMRLETGVPLIVKHAELGEVEKAQMLLDAGADVDLVSTCKEHYSKTALLMTLSNPSRTSVPLITVLLDHGASLQAVDTKYQRTPLHYAAIAKVFGRGSKLVDIIKLLLSRGAMLDPIDTELRTPLHLVANMSTDSTEECKDVERFFIRKGANLFALDIQNRLPIHYLFMDVKNDNNRTPCDPVESFTMFASAMKYEGLDMVDANQQTLLHRAVIRGATVCAMLLLQKGCKIDRRDLHGNTAVSLAIHKKHESCTLMLIQKGADINVDIIDKPDADKPPVESTDEIDNADKSYANIGTLQRVNTMERTIRKNITLTKKPPMKYLRRHYKPAWKPGQRGYPAFQGIVMNGWQGLTYLTLDLLEPFGMEYASAIEIALRLHKYRFALTLITKQMDDMCLLAKNEQQQNLLHVLASTAVDANSELQIECMKELIEQRHLDVNDQDSEGFTILQYGALGGHDHIIKYLTTLADLDIALEDHYGRSVLVALLWQNLAHQDCLSLLCNLGAKLNDLYDFPPMDHMRQSYLPTVDAAHYCQRYNSVQTSPLIHAVCNGWHDVVVCLLKNGADRNLADSCGMTPIMHAAKQNDVLSLVILLSDSDSFDLKVWKEKETERNEDMKNNRIRSPTDKAPFLHMPALKFSSDLKSDLQDNNGQTALHHYFTSLPVGIYEDLKVAKYLHNAEASFDVKDKVGKTPLDYVKNFPAVYGKCMKYICGEKNVEMPAIKSEWPTKLPADYDVANSPDYEVDAGKMLKIMLAEEDEMEDKGVLPDKRASLSNGIVLMDDSLAVPYDVLMNKVDVRIGHQNLYNFYKMQVLHDLDKDIYLLLNCWGRIGDQGQYQRTPFVNKEECVKEFCKVFKAKSGNEWNDIKSFEIKPRKYRLVEANYRSTNKIPDVRFDLSSKQPCVLPLYIQDMLLEFTSLSMLTKAMVTTGTDVPFGKLKRENLFKARDILSKISVLIRKQLEMEKECPMKDQNAYQQLLQKTSDLSSEYYYLVPQTGYEYENLAPFLTLREVDVADTNLANMFDLDTIGKMLLAAQYRKDEINPLDYVYQCLGAKIQRMDDSDPEVKLIMKYIYATAKSCVDIQAIYFYQHSESKGTKCKERQFNPKNLGNKKLLWHGSRTSNLLSILKTGLVESPRNVPQTGQAFGKGVYTADVFNKSDSYCYNDLGGTNKYMLLCEVALGTEFRKLRHAYYSSGAMDDEREMARCNSTRTVPNKVPDAQFNVKHPAGPTIPLGPLVTNYEPNHKKAIGITSRFCEVNEYIVRDSNQVGIRYIVQYS